MALKALASPASVHANPDGEGGALSIDTHCGKLGLTSRSSGECWLKFNWNIGVW